MKKNPLLYSILFIVFAEEEVLCQINQQCSIGEFFEFANENTHV